MKKHSAFKHAVLLIFFLPNLAMAQLRLQAVEGKKTVEIPIGATVGVKLPTPGEQDGCDCYQLYKGILKGMETDKARMLVQEEKLVFRDANGAYKKIETSYFYTQEELITDITIGPALSVTKYADSGDASKGFGALVAGAALLQSFAISPFLSDKARGVSDKIVWGGIGVGLTMMLLPTKKTYHFQPVKGKRKNLWRLM